MKNKKLIIISLALLFIMSSCGEDDPCEATICNNGGQCIEGICDCPEGFSGPNCDTEDLCITSDIICNNGGQCIDGSCDCPDGFSGPNCDTEDLCITGNITCENGGQCIDGVCQCPRGFMGDNCELIDTTDIQFLLDEGLFTPLEMVQNGIPINTLYGMMYADGLIFYIDIDNRLTGAEGLVAAKEDQSNNAKAECRDMDNPELDNTSYSNTDPGNFRAGGLLGDGKSNTDKILDFCEVNNESAAKICRDLGPEWFLPSMEELYILDLNLPRELSLFSDFDYYWSSSEESGSAQWAMDRNNRFDQLGKGSSFVQVRAVKQF